MPITPRLLFWSTKNSPPPELLTTTVVSPLSSTSSVEPVMIGAAVCVPTCRRTNGLEVPMPTWPLALMSMLLVGAPGRILKGRRLPPVTSRTKKLASLPAMSQVCAVNPLELFCSSRAAGVSPVFTCRSNTGVEVRNPTRPVLATKTELVGAPAVIVNGTFAPVISSIENLLAPPLAESLAVSCQSLAGNPAAVDVSSNLIRVLFSLSLIVSKPNDSLLTQSSPTQAEP